MKFYKEKFQLKRVNHKELPSSVYQDQDVDRLTKDPIGFNNTDAGKCFYNQKEDQWTCLPSMVGLGAMKASTGELRLWIRSHPRMKYSRKMGEVHYYDKRYQTFESFPRIGQKKFDLEAFKSDPAHIEGYLNYFPKIETHKMLENPLFFEKNPGLDIANPLTFRHTLPNNAKYFILLRDPAERLYSGFWWHCNRRFKELECSNEILLDYVKKMEVAKKEIYAATTAENIVKAGVKMFGKKFTVSENKDYQAYMYRFFMREVLQSMYQHLIERYENAYDVNTDYSNDNKRSNNANLIVLYSDTIKLQPEQAMFDVEKVLNIAHYNYSQLVKKTPQGWSTIDIKATKAFEKHHVNYTKLNQQPEIKKRLSDFYADANINLRNKFLKAKEFKNNFLIISEPLPKWLQ